METQRQQVHVLERAHGEPAHRVHRYLGKDAVAPLREHPHDDTHAAIGQRHHCRRRQRPGDDVIRAERRGAVARQRVCRPFEGERHRDGRQLRREDQDRGEHHAPFEVAPLGRPDVRPQMHKRREQRPAVGADFALDTMAGPLKIAHRKECTARRRPSRRHRHIEGFAALRTGAEPENLRWARIHATSSIRRATLHEQNQCAVRLLRIEPGDRSGIRRRSARPRQNPGGQSRSSDLSAAVRSA